MKTRIRIALFGRFCLQFGAEPPLDQLPHKAQELLAYLVLHRRKAHPRDTLAELLWGDRDSPNSRKYLRQALWQLHSGLLSAGHAQAAQLLHAESDWLVLALDERAEADVVEFEDAFGALRATQAGPLRSDEARELAAAARLYRGDLLEGWSAQWCAYERERFRRMHLSILDRLMEYYEMRHEYETAIAYGTIALRSDRARERTHRALMRSLAKSGERSEALRQYERCVAALRDELDVEPEPETVVLEREVRAGNVIGAVREPVAARGGGSGAITNGRELSVLASQRRASGKVPAGGGR